MSITKRRIANLDPAESYKPHLVTTQWLDNNGVVRTTVHDGNFSPSPQEPTLVFIPAEFCDEIPGMNQKEENPQQVLNGSEKQLRAAFIAKLFQGSSETVFTIDGEEYEAENQGIIAITENTISDFSEDFKEYLTPYIGEYQMMYSAAEIEDWLENGVHTLKVEYNGEVSETMTFTVASADYMYFEAAEANSTVGMTSDLPTAPNLEYSTDGETWQEWQHTTADGTHTFDTLTLTAVGDRVYLRGDNPNGLGFLPEGAEEPNISNFVLTGAINGGGNIMSLLDTTMALTEVPQFGFILLFAILGEGLESALLTAPEMDTITTIGDSGCYYMYYGCTSLTSAASMPIVGTINNSGCFGMYGECTSITSAADMPALTTIGDYGCNSMYGGCTSLNSAASMPLVSSIDKGGCLQMYLGCTFLTSAADMPALTTISEEGCSLMYAECTSLTSDASMPLVSSIDKKGCFGMYGECTSLTSASDMPALTSIGEYGCYSMFEGSRLNAAVNMPILSNIGKDGCGRIYYDCTFAMSSDGTTFNFDFPTPPITTTGESPTTYTTAYDVANWMGNTNGFTNP